MGTHTPHRSRTFRTGLAAAAAGILLAVSGVAVAPASADQGQGQVQAPADGKITICHRTNAVDNPYRIVEVAFDSTNGELRGPDHTGHDGLAFDYDADPTDPGYPYNPPMNGDEWGDIIPPYEWDGGSYAGSQAWLGGGADILTTDCNGGTDVEDVDLCDDGSEVGEDGLCEEDPVDACPDLDGFQSEGPCEEAQVVDVCPEEGVQSEGPCEEVQVVDLCQDVPGTQTGLPCAVDACPDVDGFQATDDACQPQLIPPLVLENLPPQAQAPEVVPTVVPAAPSRPVQVAGIQVLPTTTVAAQELPRTGVDTGTLVTLGLGLVLAGAGVMVAARRPEGATAH